MYSTEAVASCFEIWLFGPGRYTEPVQACGMYDEYRDALRGASAVETWLHTGVWTDRLPPDLLELRVGLVALGLDPASVDARAVERGSESDSEVWAPADSRYYVEDEELDDTILELPGVLYVTDCDEAS